MPDSRELHSTKLNTSLNGEPSLKLEMGETVGFGKTVGYRRFHLKLLMMICTNLLGSLNVLWRIVGRMMAGILILGELFLLGKLLGGSRFMGNLLVLL